jgi:hypothetical protein
MPAAHGRRFSVPTFWQCSVNNPAQAAPVIRPQEPPLVTAEPPSPPPIPAPALLSRRRIDIRPQHMAGNARQLLGLPGPAGRRIDWYGAVTAEHNFGSDEQMFGAE